MPHRSRKLRWATLALVAVSGLLAGGYHISARHSGVPVGSLALPEKAGTSVLPGFCTALASADDLQPGDIMNAPHGHVVLFAQWLDAAKSRALFYEAQGEPQAKVVASKHRIFWLRVRGAQPLRYSRITD